MGPGSFEDNIREKFENQTYKSPEAIWDGIEGDLNLGLLASYEASQSRYKWMAVAAIMIAVSSWAFHFYSYEFLGNHKTETSYNALLSNDIDYSNYFLPVEVRSSRRIADKQLLIVEVYKKSESIPVDDEVISDFEPYRLANHMVPIKNKPGLAVANQEVYPYIQAGYYARSSKNTAEGTKLWAGVEAGAGNFNSTMSGSDAISGGVNPLNLANAIGSDGFVNPTTVVNPQMNNGLATTVGLDFGLKLGSRWTLESGIAYTNVDSRGSASINVLDVYTVNDREISDTDGGLLSGSPVIPDEGSREAPLQITEMYDHEVDLRNTVRFTSIPLKAGYFILDRKVSLRVNAGVAANYLVESQLNDPSRGIISGSQNDLYNDWSFDGVGGFELGYALFNKFDLTLEPNYRHSITPISSSQTSPSRFIIQTGLRYTLK